MSKRLFPINPSLRKAILEAFNGRCVYCKLPIGGAIERKGQWVVLRAHVDHFVPYAYTGTTIFKDCVLSCHVCNLIKSSKMFRTIEDAAEHIMKRRKKKGFKP